MESEEYLLGYDVRMMQPAKIGSWTEDRKRAYLLKQDVEFVLSTDVHVWPSLFTRNEFIVAGSESANTALFLWRELSRLVKYVEKSGGDRLAGCYCKAIAIGLVLSTLSSAERQQWQPMLWSTIPATVESRWTLLGYDVSDTALLSSLSNCAYSPSEARELGAQFAEQLNSYHLFNSLKSAQTFSRESNRRVPEHAPFFVFSLYNTRVKTNSDLDCSPHIEPTL
jgi:hypothetical protein